MASDRSTSTSTCTGGKTALLSVVDSSCLNDAYSDMKIICGDMVFPARRMILCPNSEYFRAACSGNFTEASGEIRLDDKEPTLIEKMLEFLYRGFYTVSGNAVLSGATMESTQQPPAKRRRTTDETEVNSCAPDVTNPHPGYFHLRMYGLADYFMMDCLKRMARRQFVIALNTQSNWCGIEQVIAEIYATCGNYEELRAPLIKRIVDRGLDENDPQIMSYIQSVAASLNSISAFAEDFSEEIEKGMKRRQKQT